MEKDPVCFAEVDEVDAVSEGLVSTQNDQAYYFCSEHCKERFERDPGAFMMGTDWVTAEADSHPDNFIG